MENFRLRFTSPAATACHRANGCFRNLGVTEAHLQWNCSLADPPSLPRIEDPSFAYASPLGPGPYCRPLPTRNCPALRPWARLSRRAQIAEAAVQRSGRCSINTGSQSMPEEYSSPYPVWLVGAGPGDPELLTRKAERLLREADIVFYDSLVGAGVLALIPAHANRSAEHTPELQSLMRNSYAVFCLTKTINYRLHQ